MNKIFSQYDLGQKVKGFVSFKLFDPKTRIVSKQVDRRNLVLYSGADILASLIAAQGSPVNAMYNGIHNPLGVEK